MSGRGSKRDGSEDSTPDGSEKKRMCQEAARGQQGKITPWDPLRQDVARLWSNGGKGISALIDVLENYMEDKLPLQITNFFSNHAMRRER